MISFPDDFKDIVMLGSLEDGMTDPEIHRTVVSIGDGMSYGERSCMS